jgi:hypothetical protein
MLVQPQPREVAEERVALVREYELLAVAALRFVSQLPRQLAVNIGIQIRRFARHHEMALQQVLPKAVTTRSQRRQVAV